MSKNLLGNSKAALAFAGLTIVMAVALVGPQGGGGLLGRAQDGVEEQPPIVAEANEAPSTHAVAAAAEPLDPASGWGGTPDPVFGDYSSEEVLAEDSAENARRRNPSPPRRNDTGRSAPANGAIGGPVRAHSPGVLVPRPDETAGGDASSSPFQPAQFR